MTERSPLEPHAASASELKERIEADRRGEPYLVYRDGEDRQRIVPLTEERPALAIGRATDADVPLSWDGEVSRTHALLERIGTEWVLVDDGLSRNGSFVNGERVSGRRRLVADDVLRVGGTSIAFRGPAGTISATREVTDGGEVQLSEAQRRVLLALCRPFAESSVARPATNKEIADELYLSVEAVKTHMRTLFDRLSVEDGLARNEKRLRLVERAFSSGVVTRRDLEGSS